MLEIERRRMTLSGKSPGEVNDGMQGYEELYKEYLIHGKRRAGNSRTSGVTVALVRRAGT